MDEKRKQEEGAKETTENLDGGKPNTGPEKGKESLSMLDEAKAINEKKEELLNREEKLMERKETFEAERMVGGTTQAGQTPQEQTEEQKSKAAAKEFWKGTPLEDAIDKS